MRLAMVHRANAPIHLVIGKISDFVELRSLRVSDELERQIDKRVEGLVIVTENCSLQIV